MQYEYDPEKSRLNKAKHGIDFEASKLLWADKYALRLDARSDTEPRYMVIGRIDDVLWTAFITYRGEAARIISVRRARKQEAKIYEEAIVRRGT
jgi:uncharacterized DUF497 family protein